MNSSYLTTAIKRITKSRDVKALNKLKLPTKSFEVSCIEAWVVWQNEGYQQVDLATIYLAKLWERIPAILKQSNCVFKKTHYK